MKGSIFGNGQLACFNACILCCCHQHGTAAECQVTVHLHAAVFTPDAHRNILDFQFGSGTVIIDNAVIGTFNFQHTFALNQHITCGIFVVICVKYHSLNHTVIGSCICINTAVTIQTDGQRTIGSG